MESYRSCAVAGRQCCRCRGDGRFGKNEELDGFLEPVNLFDLVFNFGVCWMPAEAAGACFCFFMLTPQSAAPLNVSVFVFMHKCSEYLCVAFLYLF